MITVIVALVFSARIIWEIWYVWLTNRDYWAANDELVGLAYFETPSSARLHGKWWKTRDYISPPKRFWEKWS